ncbi:MAG: hypothetical protein AAF642_01155 [Pseudomonadota bacterium]
MDECRTTWVSEKADGTLDIVDAGNTAANERLMKLVSLHRRALSIDFIELADDLQEIIDEMRNGEWLNALSAVDHMISNASYALGQNQLRVATPGWLRGEASRRVGEPYRCVFAPLTRSIAPERPEHAGVLWFSKRMTEVLNDPYDLEVDEDVREEALKAIAELGDGPFSVGNIRSYYYGMSLHEMLTADGEDWADEIE